MAVVPHPKGEAFKIWKALMHPPKKQKMTEKERKTEQMLSSPVLNRLRKY